MKKCYKCKKEKNKNDFYKNKHQPDGLRGECKKCSYIITSQYQKNNPEKMKATDLRYRLKHKYKITAEEYYQLGETYNWCCAICRQNVLKETLAIDHDHKTGKVRGLLCRSCNHGLGNFKDNPKLLERASGYISLFT